MTGMRATVEDGGHCTVFVCQKCLHRQWISNKKLEYFRENYPGSAIDSPMLDAVCPRCHRVGALAADPVAQSLWGDQFRELQDRQDGAWPMSCGNEGCEARRYVVVFGNPDSNKEGLKQRLASAEIPGEFCCAKGHHIVGIATTRQNES
jgi:hypothetical protein